MEANEQTLAERIGAQVRRRRKGLGLTQKAVAEAAGLHQPDFCKIENGTRGEVTLAVLIRLGDALGCKASTILRRLDL